jgi:hypothetical protein
VAKLFIFLTICLSSFAASAKDFAINIPEGWREVKDLYGIPFTLLGPSITPKPRAVIQIIPTDLPPAKMNDTEAVSFGIKYAQGRKSWIKDQDGEIYDILTGKFEKDRLVTGFSYRLNQKSFIERTYYVNCAKRLFHLKIILNFENRNQLSESESIVRSFSCGS